MMAAMKIGCGTDRSVSRMAWGMKRGNFLGMALRLPAEQTALHTMLILPSFLQHARPSFS
jgi:hypothetical protein